ncbi:PaaI family thioesterase [Rubrivivax albus]|uniref:PaaI family thioesterase n=1 Tax=Rubrivivax albus TaxID=2499835 RepID=A0A437JTG3_9BURK|nr:PaaI family thioesterase [Rubrivivax albus]RVT50446.1 PaaI family thioesterase [Rubrivivax albus]
MTAAELDVAALNAILADVTAPFVKVLDLSVTAATPQQVTLRMPVTPTVVHAGGVVCGQALMAAADTAMILAVAASLGEFRPMTTVQLQTSFLKPVPKDCPEVQVVCTLLRRGRSLAFGEVALRTPDGTLAAHATTTYALL